MPVSELLIGGRSGSRAGESPGQFPSGQCSLNRPRQGQTIEIHLSSRAVDPVHSDSTSTANRFQPRKPSVQPGPRQANKIIDTRFEAIRVFHILGSVRKAPTPTAGNRHRDGWRSIRCVGGPAQSIADVAGRRINNLIDRGPCPAAPVVYRRPRPHALICGRLRHAAFPT
jgi:hypothetical protein